MGLRLRLIKNSGYLTIGNQIGNLLQFLFFLFFARKFGEEVVGQYSFAFSFTFLFSMFADLGLTTYVIREVARDRSDSRQIFLRCLILRMLSLTVFSLIAAAIVFLFFTNLSGEAVRIILLLGLYQIFFSIADLILAELKGHERMGVVALLNFIGRFIISGAGMLLIVKGYDFPEVLTCFPVGAFIYLSACIAVAYRYFKGVWIQPEGLDLSGLFHTILPFAFTIMFVEALYNQDILLLRYFQNDQAVGVYSPANTIVLSFLGILLFVHTALLPAFSRLYVESRSELIGVSRQFLRYLLLISLPLATGMFAISDKLIVFLFSEKFLYSAEVLKWLSWTIAFSFTAAIYSILLTAINRQDKKMVAIGICLVFNFLLNLMLIPRLSYGGAAMARLMTEILHFILMAYLASKYLPSIPVHKILIKPALSCIPMYFFIRMFYQWNLVLLILISPVVYFLSLAVMRGYTTEETGFIKQQFSKRILNSGFFKTLILVFFIMLLIPGYTYSADVVINGSVTHQTIEGWGITHFIKWDWEGPARYPVSERAVMKQIKEMGIDHVLIYDVKFWEERNDDDNPFHFNWAYYNEQFNDQAIIFERMREINEEGYKFAPAPFSMPAWMCNDRKKFNSDLPGVYDEIGEYWAAFILYAKKNYGITIPYIIIQTEPSWHGCTWEPEGIKNAVRSVGKRLMKEGIGAMIIAPDDASAKASRKMSRAILTDPEASRHIKKISFHVYDKSAQIYGPDVAIRALKELAGDEFVKGSGLSLWMTEWAFSHAYGKRMRDWVDSLRLALDFAKMVYNAQVYGNASLYVIWSSQYDWGSDIDGNGLLENEGIFGPGVTDGKLNLKKYGHVLSQYTRYIPPGSKRIDASISGASNIFVTAYKDDKTKRFTVEFINKDVNPHSLNIDIKNIQGLSALDVIRTSATESSADLGRVSVVDNSFKYTLPKESVTTFTGTLSPPS